MSYVLKLPNISNPIEQFTDFKFVNWTRTIYPKFKGEIRQSEIDFFANIIEQRGAKEILDLGVGGGQDLAAIVETLNRRGYKYKRVEGNEIDPAFERQARELFTKKGLDIPVHHGNWLDLPDATPSYYGSFDFAMLVGNSLTYIGGAAREYTQSAQKSIIKKFAEMVRKGGYLLIDTRNYDYIRTLANQPHEEVIKSTVNKEKTVWYHGTDKVLVVPGYISETVVVLHYYDLETKRWGKLDLYPIYKNDLIEMLQPEFEIERIYYDFEEKENPTSLFIQFLARRQ